MKNDYSHDLARNVRLLLTGGTGFFGRSLLRHWCGLSVSAYPVTVVTRDIGGFLQRYPEFQDQPWLRFFEADLIEADALRPLSGFTHVLHAATESTKGPRIPPLDRFEQIVNSTRQVLAWASRSGVRRFLLTSSGGVYGRRHPPEPWKETDLTIPDPLNPASAYGIGKRVCEHLCTLYSSPDFEVTIARCFAFIGEDLPLDVHFAAGNFIRDALFSEEILVQGDGSAVRSYMDQRDLAEWLLTLLFHGQAGEAYNVGSDQPISILELAHQIRDQVAPHKAIKIMGDPSRRDGSEDVYLPNLSKAKGTLGLDLHYSLAQSINQMLSSLREQHEKGGR